MSGPLLLSPCLSSTSSQSPECSVMANLDILPVSFYHRRHWFFSASAYYNLHFECLLSQRLSKLPTDLP